MKKVISRICLFILLISIAIFPLITAYAELRCSQCFKEYKFEKKFVTKVTTDIDTHTINGYETMGCPNHGPFTLVKTNTQKHTYGSWTYHKDQNQDIAYCTCSGCVRQIWRTHQHHYKLSGGPRKRTHVIYENGKLKGRYDHWYASFTCSVCKAGQGKWYGNTKPMITLGYDYGNSLP